MNHIPQNLIKITKKWCANITHILNSPSFSSLLVFASGNLFVAALGGVSGLIQARWLEPEVFGEFRKYGILTLYLSLGKVFVHTGLMRQYPYLLGKKRAVEALDIAGTAKWWYCFVTSIYIILFATLSGVALFRTDYRGAIGWGAQIPGAITLIYGSYLGVMYRTSSDFKRLSYNRVITTILGTLQLVMVKLFGYWGLAARFMFMNLFSVLINQKYLPVKPKMRFDSKSLRSLASISLKISIPGYFHSTALTASLNALVLYYCGEEGLGIYAVAVMVQTMALQFSSALNQIFNVKISTRYGQTEDVYKCLKYAMIPCFLSIALSILLSVCLCVCIGPFIRSILPRYVESIPVIRILSIALIIHASSLPLLVISSALWYKTHAFKCILNFCVALIAIILLPKSATMVAVSTILGLSAEMIAGYSCLFLNIRRNSSPKGAVMS